MHIYISTYRQLKIWNKSRTPASTQWKTFYAWLCTCSPSSVASLAPVQYQLLELHSPHPGSGALWITFAPQCHRIFSFLLPVTHHHLGSWLVLLLREWILRHANSRLTLFNVIPWKHLLTWDLLNEGLCLGGYYKRHKPGSWVLSSGLKFKGTIYVTGNVCW